jgi:hypothetical protein
VSKRRMVCKDRAWKSEKLNAEEISTVHKINRSSFIRLFSQKTTQQMQKHLAE